MGSAAFRSLRFSQDGDRFTSLNVVEGIAIALQASKRLAPFSPIALYVTNGFTLMAERLFGCIGLDTASQI